MREIKRRTKVFAFILLSTIFSIRHFIHVAQLARRLSVSYPTPKADAQRLVDAGILRELYSVRPKTLYAPEVFDVAYDRLEDN